MALKLKFKDLAFGVGDRLRVTQRLKEGEKFHTAFFEGLVIAIKAGKNQSFVLRHLGEQKIGIEKIYPLNLPSLDKIQVLKSGTAGVKHAKLYYVRQKSPREIDVIYARAARKNFQKTK